MLTLRRRKRPLWTPTVAATGWSDAQIESFRNALRPGGWRVDLSEGRIVLSRARGGVSS